MLAPEGYGEIIGGSQRMASYELLLQRIHEHGLPEEAFKWYLDLRKFGSVPHGGFGMGIERAVAWICGLEHVRETIPFPEDAVPALSISGNGRFELASFKSQLASNYAIRIL